MISVLFLGSICLEGTRKVGVGSERHVDENGQNRQWAANQALAKTSE